MVRMWDVRTGARRLAFTGHGGAFNAVAFSSMDGILRISDRDRTIRTVKLGLMALDVCWSDGLLGVAVDRAVVILQISDTPNPR